MKIGLGKLYFSAKGQHFFACGTLKRKETVDFLEGDFRFRKCEKTLYRELVFVHLLVPDLLDHFIHITWVCLH